MRLRRRGGPGGHLGPGPGAVCRAGAPGVPRGGVYKIPDRKVRAPQAAAPLYPAGRPATQPHEKAGPQGAEGYLCPGRGARPGQRGDSEHPRAPQYPGVYGTAHPPGAAGNRGGVRDLCPQRK